MKDKKTSALGDKIVAEINLCDKYPGFQVTVIKCTLVL